MSLHQRDCSWASSNSLQLSKALSRVRLPLAHVSTFSYITPWRHPKPAQSRYRMTFSPSFQLSSVQSLSCVRLFANPWTAARQASLSITNSWSSSKLMSIESVMPHSRWSPSPPALNPSQHQSLFKWVSSLHQVAKEMEFQLQHQSFQWTPRTDL